MMTTAGDLSASTQQTLLRELLRNRAGLTIEALTKALGISRNAVRQHITSLERDGLVARGKTQPSGGRPQQLYVLTSAGEERFPRQYSWFSELLLRMLEAETGRAGLEEKLAEMGRTVAASLQGRVSQQADPDARIAAIAEILQELGYDAIASSGHGEPQIEARNCVFHKLAAQHPEVCRFDLALLSSCSGHEVEHSSCMVRGSDACRFRFVARKQAPPASPGGPLPHEQK